MYSVFNIINIVYVVYNVNLQLKKHLSILNMVIEVDLVVKAYLSKSEHEA